MKILIVDDNARIRQTISKMLLRHFSDAILLERDDGSDAVECFNMEKPDLILIDIIMNKMDGFTAIKHIRRASSSVKIIVVSQLGDKEFRDEAFNSGADDFINKENLLSLHQSIVNLFH